MTPSTALMRCLETNELTLLQPLFESVFKQPVSAALLEWKYAGGRGESWAAWQAGDDRPFLHCGLSFRDVLVAGAPVRAAQLVDLMAEPKRAGLSREQSPFALLMRKILDSLPRPDNSAGVAFGFPSDRAMRLGEHAGVYRSVGHWQALEFGGIDAVFGPRVRVWHPEQAADLALADRLWRAMARDLVDYSVGVRDSSQLIHRYLRHPEKQYTLWVAESRWLRQPMGIVVVGGGPDHYEILDVLGRREDMPEIIRAVQRWLHRTQGQSLTLMLTAPFAEQLGAFADRRTATQFRIMANPWTPAATLAQLDGRWWLTGGDTDYR